MFCVRARRGSPAKDGARSSPHYGGEGVSHTPIAPRCLLAARYGRFTCPHQDGPVAADDPNRDLDDTHFWKLSDQGSNFAIEAYFVGPRTNYHTICGIHADNVDVAAFLEGLKRGTKLPDPLTKSDPETGRLTYTWTAKADGGKDALKVAAYKNGRVSITFTYTKSLKT